MACVEWWCLTDDELLLLFHKKKERGVKYLKVHGYKQEVLTFIPDLTYFSQFNGLCHLDLSWNDIDDLKLEHIPQTLEVLNLSYNRLQVLPPLDKFVKLKELVVSHNQIAAVHPDVPITLELIDFSFNCIQVIPPLNKLAKLKYVHLSNNQIDQMFKEQFPVHVEKLDLSHNSLQMPLSLTKMASLKDLDLSYNQLKVISGIFPASLQVLNLSGNSNIKELPSVQTSNIRELQLTDLPQLNTLLGLSANLKVLNVGLQPAIKILHEPCFPNRSVYHIVKKSLGPKGISQLKKPPPVMMNQSHASIVRFFKEDLASCSWNHISLYGSTEAGKTSLLRTLLKARPSLTKNVDRTMFVKAKTWNISEKNRRYFVFDHSGSENRDELTSMTFNKNNRTILIVHSMKTDSKQHIGKTLEIFKKTLLTSGQDPIYFVLTHVDKHSPNVATHLVDHFKEHVNSFFTKENAFLKKEAESYSEKQRSIEELIELMIVRQQSLQYFPLSCKTYMGVDTLRDHLIHFASKKTVFVPLSWIQFFDKLNEEEQPYISVTEAESMFKQATGISYPNSRTLRQKTKDCLQYFHDIGRVIWIDGHHILKNFVFHNFNYVFRILKEIFQVATTMVQEERETDIKKMVSIVESEGLIHTKLFHATLIKFGLKSMEQEAVVQLLIELKFATSVINNNSLLYFFPWLVTRRETPETLSQSPLVVVDNDIFSLVVKCDLYPAVPDEFVHHMCIFLQNTVPDQGGKIQRQTWISGLMITSANNRECFVYRDSDNSVLFNVSGLAIDIGMTWQMMGKLYHEIEKMLVCWPGVQVSMSIICPHCILQGILEPHYWPATSVWSVSHHKTNHMVCPQQPDKHLPSALVQYVSISDSKQLNRAHMYLQDNWTEVSRKDQLPLSVKSYVRKNLHHFQSIMLTSPVINELTAKNMISGDFRSELENLESKQQAARLVDKLLRGSITFMEDFKGVLTTTGYHTNITLAKLIPDSEKETPREKPDELLTAEEQLMLKNSFYEAFVRDVDPLMFISALSSSASMHQCHMTELRKIKSNYKQLVYLLEEILLRGTYLSVLDFHNALIQCSLTEIHLKLRPETSGGQNNSVAQSDINNLQDQITQHNRNNKVKQTKICAIL